MSPWAKLEKGAEAIGPDFVFSRKPNPAMVAMDQWVPAIAEKDFTDVLEATRANGCPVEFTLKDICTCRRPGPPVGVVLHRGADDPGVGGPAGRRHLRRPSGHRHLPAPAPFRAPWPERGRTRPFRARDITSRANASGFDSGECRRGQARAVAGPLIATGDRTWDNGAR